MLDREQLEHMVAEKLLEVADQEDLQACYYECQKEWTETLQDLALVQTAQDLGLPIQVQVLDAGTPNATRIITLTQDN